MDEIIDSLVRAGYYRARISNLSDFDKIIGGMAWAMQLFSYDINIDVFYADSLDLGQKIALTERLVMVLIALRCPYRLEPHQIVGLDYGNMLPAIRWLLKRSEEVRREHAAFNRLLALRHYHRVTNTALHGPGSATPGRPGWRHVVSVAHLEGDGGGDNEQPQAAQSTDERTHANDLERRRTDELLASINENFKDNKQVSFVKLATVLRAASSKAADGRGSSHENDSSEATSTSGLDQSQHLFDRLDQSLEDEDEAEVDSDHRVAITCFTDDDAKTTISEDGEEEKEEREAQLSLEERELHKKLDLELLATNQKILNLLKKLDLMPSQLEICQYQRRYIELHQQLISKNKDVKKLFDLYNSLDVEKHYLERELSLLESIGDNLHLTNNSVGNRDLLMRQLEAIIVKIQSIRDDMGSRVAGLREKCGLLNEEYVRLMEQSE